MFNCDKFYMFSCSKIAHVTFVEKPQLKIVSFLNHKHGYLIFASLIRQSFLGYVCESTIFESLIKNLVEVIVKCGLV